jgi:hypothetical protein
MAKKYKLGTDFRFTPNDMIFRLDEINGKAFLVCLCGGVEEKTVGAAINSDGTVDALPISCPELFEEISEEDQLNQDYAKKV